MLPGTLLRSTAVLHITCRHIEDLGDFLILSTSSLIVAVAFNGLALLSHLSTVRLSAKIERKNSCMPLLAAAIPSLGYRRGFVA